MEQRKIEYTIVDINSVKAHEKNVRHGDIGAISESLKAHGQYKPIVVDQRTNQILAGNHTWKAAKALGWKQISVAFVETKDEEEALRILLADNRTTDLSAYDDDGLAELLKSLSGSPDGLTGTLFDGDDLDDLIFKLEGTLGFVQTVSNAKDQMEIFELTDTRNLIFPFPKEEIDEIKLSLDKLRESLGLDSFSDVLLYLLREHDESN